MLLVGPWMAMVLLLGLTTTVRLEGVNLAVLSEKRQSARQRSGEGVSADLAFTRVLTGLTKEMTENFNALDADGNGKLSKDEVKAAVMGGIMR